MLATGLCPECGRPMRRTCAVVEIPAPCEWLSANDRKPWRVKASLTKEWREAAGWRAREAKVPAMQRAEIEVRLIFTQTRRRDPHNYMPTAKAAIDGLVDAGVLPDDSAAHLTVTRIDVDAPNGELRRGVLRLLITDLGGKA